MVQPLMLSIFQLKVLPQELPIYLKENAEPFETKPAGSFRTALKRAGIKDFRFHDLRHTSASYLIMRGASLKSVQQQLGHTTLKMTERYAHLSDQFQREEVNRLNGLLPFPLAGGKKLVRSWEKEGLPIFEEAYNA